MSLRVICPQGCRFVLPLSEAGRQVVCPECQAALAIPDLPLRSPKNENIVSDLVSDLVIVTAKAIHDEAVTISPEDSATQDPSLPIVVAWDEPSGRLPNLSLESDQVLPVIDVDDPQVIPTQEDLALPEIVLDDDRLEAFEIRQNVRAFETSRRSIARIIAFFIAVLGCANIVLALWQSGWLDEGGTEHLQMWATVSVMIGVIHLAYAFFLSQLGDWSANWVAASFLLAVAAGYASASVVLGFAGMDNVFVQWLELPVVLQTKGAIWSACMVLITASLAWWCGREAMHWRQTVQWLRSF